MGLSQFYNYERSWVDLSHTEFVTVLDLRSDHGSLLTTFKASVIFEAAKKVMNIKKPEYTPGNVFVKASGSQKEFCFRSF
jgi:hypothetical protein